MAIAGAKMAPKWGVHNLAEAGFQSGGAMTRYMQSSKDWRTLLSATIESASAGDLELVDAKVVSLNDEVRTLLEDK